MDSHNAACEMEASCAFCRELQGEGSIDATQLVRGDRVIARTDRFVLMPTLGPLTETHLLFVPTAHTGALGRLSTEARREAEALVDGYAKSLEETLNATVLRFEHGLADDEAPSGGCGVTHAHLHIVAVGGECEVPVEPPSGPTFRWSTSAAGHWLDDLPQEEDYLLFRSGWAATWVTAVRDLPSQFMRRWLADLLSVSEWDWRRCPAPDESLRQAVALRDMSPVAL